MRHRLKQAISSSRLPLLTIGAIFVILLLVFIILLSASPFQRPIPLTDSAIFLYSGRVILDGGDLYTDVWDHKGPIIFFLNALGQAVNSNSYWGVWLLQLIAVGAAALIGFFHFARHFGRSISVLVTVLWLLALNRVLDGGNLTEVYALPFQFASLYFLSKAIEHAKAPSAFLLGLFAAIPFWLKANIVGIPAVAGGLFLYWLLNGNKHMQGRLMNLLAGFLLASILISIYFVINGTFNDFLYATFTYNFIYSSASLTERVQSVFYGLNQLGILHFFGMAGWLVALFTVKSKHSSEHKAWFSLFILWLLPLDLTLVSLSGRTYNHYYMTLLPAMALSAGYLLHVLFSDLHTKDQNANPHAIPTLALSMCLLLLLPHLKGYTNTAAAFYQLARESNGLPSPDISETGTVELLNYLDITLEPDSPFLVWGKNLAYHWIGGHNVPSGYIFQEQFLVDHPASVEMINQYIEDLSTFKPVIIDSTVSVNHLAPPLHTNVSELPDVVAPLYNFLQENYTLADYYEPYEWPIYVFTGEQ